MDIEKLIAAERQKLSNAVRSDQERRANEAREAYENDPGTKIQRYITPFIPEILNTVQRFATTIDADLSIYRSPEANPDVLVSCSLATKKGIVFKNETNIYSQFGLV